MFPRLDLPSRLCAVRKRFCLRMSSGVSVACHVARSRKYFSIPIRLRLIYPCFRSTVKFVYRQPTSLVSSATLSRSVDASAVICWSSSVKKICHADYECFGGISCDRNGSVRSIGVSSKVLLKIAYFRGRPERRFSGLGEGSAMGIGVGMKDGQEMT